MASIEKIYLNYYGFNYNNRSKNKTSLTKQGDAAFGIRKNDPVATKVTLRGDDALPIYRFCKYNCFTKS